MLDIHSHILPGIDHGAKDLAQATEMLRAAKAQGIDTLVATPHVYTAEFDRSLAQQAMMQLRPCAQQLGIVLLQGYEFNYRAMDQEKPERAAQFCIEGTQKLLLELPQEIWSRDCLHRIYDLQAYGMEIIIAHPERYRYMQKDLRIVDSLAQLDCMFQVDVPQALNRFSAQNRVLMYLMRSGLVHYAASDAHEQQDYRAFEKSIKKLGAALQYRVLE